MGHVSKLFIVSYANVVCVSVCVLARVSSRRSLLRKKGNKRESWGNGVGRLDFG